MCLIIKLSDEFRFCSFSVNSLYNTIHDKMHIEFDTDIVQGFSTLDFRLYIT
jgi:hypothetical protein